MKNIIHSFRASFKTFYSMPVAALIILVFSFVPTVQALDLGGLQIPADRVPDWTHAGVDGGIPDTSDSTDWPVIDATQSPFNANPACDNGDDRTAIQSALNAAANAYGDGRVGTIVYLPAGCYDWDSANILSIPSNVVLKGNGVDKTIIEAKDGSVALWPDNDICGTQGSVWIYGDTASHGTPNSEAISVNSGFVRGSRTLTYSSSPGYSVGDYLELRENKDPALFRSGHACDSQIFLRQIVRVSGVSGNTITLDRPVRHDFNAIYNPRTVKFIPAVNAGIENLTLRHPTDVTSRRLLLVFSYAVNSWAKNVHFYWGSNGHINISNSRDITIFENKINKDDFTAPVSEGGQGSKNDSAAIYVNFGTTDSLIVNNIFSELEVTVKYELTPIGNVYAYNYSYNLSNEYRDAFLHGEYPIETLMEGNTTVGRMTADDYWGKQGPRNTWFRNRALGTSRGIATHEDGNAFIGDYLTYIGNVTTDVYQYPGCSTPDCFDVDRYTTHFWAEKNRFTNLFVRQSDEATTTYVNERSVCTYSDDGTKDCAGFVGPKIKTSSGTASTGYDGTNPPAAWSSFKLPDSLFLTSRPNWWCAELPWPAIGADVDDINNLNKIPAQRRAEGAVCTTATMDTEAQTKPPPSPPILN